MNNAIVPKEYKLSTRSSYYIFALLFLQPAEREQHRIARLFPVKLTKGFVDLLRLPVDVRGRGPAQSLQRGQGGDQLVHRRVGCRR